MAATRCLMVAVSALVIAACGTGAMAEPDSARPTLEAFAGGVQPGCAMGIFGRGERVQYKSSGYADIARKIPITESTQFLAASASKQFTALALLHLAANGRLSLDDPARRWVPAFAGAVQDATIRQLLHQTAGVRDHVGLLTLVGVEELGSVDRSATLALMARQRNTNFPPGTRAQYSNGNYFVLSEIVARASGLALERYAAQVIFSPLQMRSTQFLSGPNPPALAQGYQPNDDVTGFELANDRPATNGSGGLITTIADLQKFNADFRSEAVVWLRDIKQQMLTPGRLKSGETAILPEFGTPYGMALGLADERGDVLVAHDGGHAGFRAEYMRLLNGGVSVAVLCNRADARASAIADHTLRAEAGLQPPDTTADAGGPAPVFTPLSPQRMAAIAGTYRSDELDATYVFKVGAEGFEVTITSPFTATPSSGTWGGLRVASNGVIHSGPVRITTHGSAERVTALSLSFGKRVEGVVLKRVDTR